MQRVFAFATLVGACAPARPATAPSPREPPQTATTPDATLRAGLTAMLPDATQARLIAPDAASGCANDAALQAAYRDGVDDALGGRRYLVTDPHVATPEGLACAGHRASPDAADARLACCTEGFDVAARGVRELVVRLNRLDSDQEDAEFRARFQTLYDPRVDRVLYCAEHFWYGFAYANEIARGLPPQAPISRADCTPGPPSNPPPPDALGCWSHGFTPEHAINQQGSAAGVLARARAACEAKFGPTP